MNSAPILPAPRSARVLCPPVCPPRLGLLLRARPESNFLALVAMGAALTLSGCKDAAKPTEAAGNALSQANPGQVKLLPNLNLKPKPFCDLTGECAIPDELALDGKGNILVSMPNCLEYEKFTPKIAMLDSSGKKTDWFVKLPLHPKTGKVHPMGMEFGPDGKPVSCEVAVEGTKLSNAIRFKGNDLYLTDTFFDLPDKRDQSGVWRFSLNEIGAGKPVVKVLPLGKDPHIIATFTAKPKPNKADGTFEEAAGADGAAFDSAGNLYVGLFGDGQFFKLTFKADGSVKTNEKIIDDPSFKCCDGIWCDQKTDKIYLANSARNSIHIYDARNHTLQMIWENADTDGKDGLLDQPCTACLLGNKLIVVNFDMPFPELLNTTHDDPITVSYFELP